MEPLDPALQEEQDSLDQIQITVTNTIGKTIINTGKTHIGIITCNHLSVAHLITDTISGLIRINWYIQVHARWVCRYRGSGGCCCCCRMTCSTRINCFQWEYCSMLMNNKTKISHKPIKVSFLRGLKLFPDDVKFNNQNKGFED